MTAEIFCDLTNIKYIYMPGYFLVAEGAAVNKRDKNPILIRIIFGGQIITKMNQ